MQSILLLALAISLAGCSQDDPASLVASAKGHMAKGDYNASIIELKNALQKDPKNAEARYLLGASSLEHGDLSSAEIELGKAIEQGFDTDEAQVALARALLAKGDANKVVSQFATKKLSSPKMHAELRATVGMAELARNRAKEARNAFAEALALDSGSVTGNLGIARLAASEQDFTNALSRVDKALAASPRSVEVHLLKGDLLAAQGQGEPAEKAYRNAVQVAPNQVPPRLSLISQLLRLQSLEKAAAEVEALAKIAPRDLRTSYARALLLVEQRKFREAREAILQVLKAGAEHVPSLVLAGLASFEIGAYPEAEGYLRKAVYNAPNAVGAKRLLAATRLRMGQTEQALNDVRELLTIAGEDPTILALAGEAHLASGDVASAARYYERAKSLMPNSAALQTRLAQIRFVAGDPARAVQELETASASHPDEYQADLALITTYLRQRQADKALDALKTLEKKQPGNPLTHNLRGVSLSLKRDFQGARASFERAVQLRPTYMPAVNNLVRLDLRDKKTEAAKKRYESILKKEPNNEQALSGLAVLLRVTGANQQEVEKLLRQSVAANPQSPSARASLVNFYLRSRDFKAALTAAQEARVALPTNAAIVEMLGVAQLAADETRQAVSTFLRLAELLPQSPQPLVRLASAYMTAKQPDEAIKSLRAALSLRADLAVVQRDIAAIYVATGRIDEALREARAVQAKHPKQPFGHVLEAEIHVAQKNWDSAERTYREVLKKFDLPLLVMRTHAVIAAAGKRSEADAMAENWVKAHPKDAAVLAYLAERDLAAKRYASATKRYRIALERQPDNPMFLNNLAWAANELKQPDALEYAERAHELAPENPAIMDTLGSILAQNDQSERGLELLARATELAPDLHQIRLNFAKGLIEAGRKAAARKELEVLAKLDSRLPVQQAAAALLAGL
jgi:putative PEP-CTERM system TPR-repeat lipoprotein